MSHRTIANRLARPASLLVLAMLPHPGQSDDHWLLKSAGDQPIVFPILDMSTSMHNVVEEGPDNEEKISWGTGEGPGGDPRQAGGRIYHVKKAFYEIVSELGSDFMFGFAVLDRDDATVNRKHWLYKVDCNDQPANSILQELLPCNEPMLFGEPYEEKALIKRIKSLAPLNTDSTTDTQLSVDTTARVFRYHSCGNELSLTALPPIPARRPDGSFARPESNWILDLPKLRSGDYRSEFYVRVDGENYRLTFSPLADPMGMDRLPVRVSLERRAGACPLYSPVASETVLLRHFFTHDFDGMPLVPDNSFIGYDLSPHGLFEIDAVDIGSACDSASGAGYDPNYDEASGSDQLSYDFTPDPHGRCVDASGRSPFDVGDFIGPDWQYSRRQEILCRLAPNMCADDDGDGIPNRDDRDYPYGPDFRVGPYFETRPVLSRPDRPREGVLPLLPAYRSNPPIWGSRGTPLAAALRDLRDYLELSYRPCARGEVDPAVSDPSFDCRPIYVILLSDGGESCETSTDLCNQAGELFDTYGVRTFAVSFGPRQSSLRCVADRGGTGVDRDGDGVPEGPGLLNPKDKDDLVAILRSILVAIQGEQRAFGATAPPTGQAELAGRLFLSGIVPLSDTAVWPGHLDMYRRPLPLRDVDGNKIPDRTAVCASPSDTGCRAWDAGEALLTQAPSEADVVAGDLKIGAGVGQRRVYYTPLPLDGRVPAVSQLFLPPDPADGPANDDLFGPQGMGIPGGDPTRGRQAIERSLVRKSYVRDGVSIPYVLGDIFHSNPTVVGRPTDARYVALNLHDDGRPCSAGNPGYRCFYERHENRRKVVLVGANDGQFHAFDAGRWNGSTFSDGSGHELFSIIPRVALPGIYQLSQAGRTGHQHRVLVDGSPAVGDAFIDPAHAANPTPSEREWRTLAVVGMREGGNGYLAIDITQPDRLVDGQPTSPSYVPSCSGPTVVAGCGPVPYPSVLWELTDPLNEDGDHRPDLGATWSKPVLTRIRVDDAGEIEDRYVVVFGGGFGGHHLYMVDVETGRILYKRPLNQVRREGSSVTIEGVSTPSSPALLDFDLDGYTDAVYIGTTAGILYKVDLSEAAPLSTFEARSYSTTGDGSWEGRMVRRVSELSWQPQPLFDTGGRPIYFPPSVIFAAEAGDWALAFGTGDREDLWSEGADGRFIVALEGHLGDGLSFETPGEATLHRIEDVTATAETRALFTEGGWYLPLRDDERLIADPFVLSGVLVFTTYVPSSETADGLCHRRGTSRLYVLNTVTGESFQTDQSGTSAAYREINDFVASPFVEATGSQGTPSPCEDQAALGTALQSLFPPGCRFSSQTLDILTVRSDSGLECLAPVPICVRRHNWLEISDGE